MLGRDFKDVGFDVSGFEIKRYTGQRDLKKIITKYLEMFFKIKELGFDNLDENKKDFYYSFPSEEKIEAIIPAGNQGSKFFLRRVDIPITTRDSKIRVEFKLYNSIVVNPDSIIEFSVGDLAKKGIFRFKDIIEMNAGDKKKLWVGYQQELSLGNATEAIHGTLFWGVKQALLNARDAQNVQRSKRLLAELAELPHESRRHGEELEYALERFILSEV